MGPLQYIIENFVGKDGTDASNLFEKAPKRIASSINNVTASAAGVKITTFGVEVLTTAEHACGLSYRESLLIHHM